MDKLDAATLNKAFSISPNTDLRTTLSNYLEPTDLDVKRLREDRSEIQLGDEVAFVAAVAFRVTSQGAAELTGATTTTGPTTGPQGLQILKDLSKEDILFSIGPDGEIVSSSVPLDNDSIAQWIANTYDFTFQLNGSHHPAFGPVGRVRIAPEDAPGTKSRIPLPWIQKLNTAAVKDDYIDVDVKIEPRASPVPSTTGLMKYVFGSTTEDNAQFLAQIVLQIPAAVDLSKLSIPIPIGDCKDGAQLQISFRLQSPPGTDPRPVAHSAPIETSSSLTKTKHSKP